MAWGAPWGAVWGGTGTLAPIRPPLPPFGARTPWVFTDPTDGSRYEWEINPDQGKDALESDYKATITFTGTSVTGGTPRLFMATSADAPMTVKVAGTIVTKSHHDALWTWFAKDHPFTLTDDLGRILTVLPADFVPQRVHKPTRDWFFTYTMDFLVLDMEDI